MVIAALCAVGGAAHVVGLGSGALHAWFFGLMALACLGCAAHLLRSRSQRALSMTAGMAAVMLVAHLGYLLAVAPALGGQPSGHGHQVLSVVAGSAHPVHPSSSLVLPLLAELAVLALALPALRRLRLSRLLRLG